MSARTRKFIGLVVILAFLAGYVTLVATLGGYVPRHWAWQLAYYSAAGLVWGVPLYPLFKWMNRGR